MITFSNGSTLSSVIRKYDSLSQPRVLTIGLTQEEVATVEGDRYNTYYDTTLSSGETIYLYGKVPAGSNVNVGFQKRIFKSLNGEAQLRVLWDSTNNGNLGAAIPIFNENNLYRGVKEANLELNLINLSNITSLGIEREVDFLTGVGSGSNSAGDISPEVGFRVYGEDTDFLIEISNLHNASNRILLGYSFIEAPLSLTV